MPDLNIIPSNDIPGKLRVPAQVVLDAKLKVASKEVLMDLGPQDNLAYTYYRGLVVKADADLTYWEWREKNFIDEVGLRPTGFVYPEGLIVDGIDYSNKSYNFFPFGLNSNTIQDNISKVIYVAKSQLSGIGTIEEQIVEYINSLGYNKTEIFSDIWIEFNDDSAIIPVDAIVSEWSIWSDCSIEGFQTRTRTVLIPAKDGGNTPVLYEEQPCTYVPPPTEPEPDADAVVSEWSDWSECQEDMQYRERTVITPATGNGTTPALIEWQGCVISPPTPVDATVSEWSEWSGCNNGSQTRTREVITPASNGGSTPPLLEVQGCSTSQIYSYKKDGSQTEGDDPTFHKPYIEYIDETGHYATFYPPSNAELCGTFTAQSIIKIHYCTNCID